MRRLIHMLPHASPLPAAQGRPVPQRLSAAAHLRAALPADGGRRAGGDRMIGMVLLQAGLRGRSTRRAADLRRRLRRAHHARRDGSTTAATTWCCAALEKFRIDGEEAADGRRSTARANHARWTSGQADSDRDGLRTERKRLQAMLAPLFERPLSRAGLPQAMPDEDLVNALAQYLEFEPIEKQALLERDGPLARCRAMMELLEMKALTRAARPRPAARCTERRAAPAFTRRSSSASRRRRCVRPRGRREVPCDLLRVEAAVLDEPAARLIAAADRAGDVHARARGLERRLVEDRRAGSRRGRRSRRSAASSRSRAGSRSSPAPSRSASRAHRRVNQHDRRRPDLRDRGVEERPDAAFLDAVLEIRLDPVLDLVRQGRAAHHQGHLRAVPIAVERGLRGRIARPDDGDALADVGERLT